MAPESIRGQSVNAICGWQFPETAVRQCLDAEQPRLLTLDFDFPCMRACNLRCRYCFIETDERERQQGAGEHSAKLTVDELKEAFEQAAALGCKSGKLVGDQEPLQETRLLEFLRFTDSLGMWVVMFSNAAVLADDAQCEEVHGCSSDAMIEELKRLRVSIMVKFHSFSHEVEDDLVRTPGYAAARDSVLERLVSAGLNEPPTFQTAEEQVLMTGVSPPDLPVTWTRLGLESVIMPQCLADVERIYRLKAMRRLYVDLDPPVPVGLTRSTEWRQRHGINVSADELLDTAVRLYSLNEDLGIPFQGASPYLGGLPCSQLPYGLYLNARGRLYPCCGCPEEDASGHSECLGHVRDPQGLLHAIATNPYRTHYLQHGFAYDTPPFNDPDYDGYGVFHGCPFRDRAGDILPKNWEVTVAEQMRK